MRKFGKAMNVALWVVSGLLAAFFLIGGVAKLVGLMDPVFSRWGYTLDTPRLLGTLELTGVLGLLFKRTAGWSAVGLGVIMLGALWTHLAHHEYIWTVAPITVILLLGFVAWGRGLPVRTRAPEESAARY